MSFDPDAFAAEIALKLIPTERIPAAAQDALEAGWDGPRVLRMAILDPHSAWEVEQTLPSLLEELGCGAVSAQDAALYLARQRAQSILNTGDDPLPSLPFFHRIMLAAGYPEELIDLGYLQDEDLFFDSTEQQRAFAIEALHELLSPKWGRRGAPNGKLHGPAVRRQPSEIGPMS